MSGFLHCDLQLFCGLLRIVSSLLKFRGNRLLRIFKSLFAFPNGGSDIVVPAISIRLLIKNPSTKPGKVFMKLCA